jgi:transposase-like protein
MTVTLKVAAEAARGSRMPRFLVSIIESVRRVFTFTHERANRLARYFKIVGAYKLGKPVRDIEAQYGCSRGTVLRYARLAGCDKRPRGFDPAVRSAVIALYQQGVPIAQIEAQLGVSQGYVSKTATEEGINRRKFKARKVVEGL